jgi:polar amino acid transport system substrate-binding protein
VFADEITLRADIWCPYNCEPDSEKPGFQVEIAKYAFEKAGHTIQYSLLNWSRAVLETRKGKYHAILGAARGDAPDFVFPQSEVGVSQDCFYVKPENTWEFRDIDSLSTITIGVINDYSYGDLFDEYIKEHKNDHKRIQISSGEDALEKNFSKLIKSRITALIEEQSVMGYFLKKISKPELVRNAGCFEGNNVYIAFSPENPKSQGYANILSQGIQELRESGKLKHILDSYGITNWK